MLIDSHCHLDAPEFDADRSQVLHDARAAGVVGVVIPGYVASRWSALLALTAAHDRVTPEAPQLWPALGLHPVHLAQHGDDDLQQLDAWLTRCPQVVAVGEIGLDRFLPELTTPAAWARQQSLFEQQLQLATRHGKPVIIHARRCHAEIVRSLKRTGFARGGILHAFSGSIEEAQAYVRLGFRLGFGGPLTYPQSRRLREAVQALPLHSLVLETDAPDLVPAPWRDRHGDGRPRQPGERVRNSPAYLAAVFETLCQLRPEPVPELRQALRDNVCSALGLRSVGGG